jgi:hypothetical protein
VTRLSERLARLAEADGDPEVFSVAVVYETRQGQQSALLDIPSGLRSFAEGMAEIALRMAHNPAEGTH